MTTKATAATTIPAIAPSDRLATVFRSAVVELFELAVAVDEDEAFVELVVASVVDELLLVEVI